MTDAVYANPMNVAPADQVAAGLDPPGRVRLSYSLDEHSLYIVDEDAVWNGMNLESATKQILWLDDGDGA